VYCCGFYTRYVYTCGLVSVPVQGKTLRKEQQNGRKKRRKEHSRRVKVEHMTKALYTTRTMNDMPNDYGVIYQVDVTEKVCFHIQLHDGASANAIKQTLEQMADDIELHADSTAFLPLVIGKANKTTYEQIFNTELFPQQRTLPCLGTERTRVETIEEWKEKKPAQIPVQLSDKITRVQLSELLYLTDYNPKL